jgi:hypothetical protein
MAAPVLSLAENASVDENSFSVDEKSTGVAENGEKLGF